LIGKYFISLDTLAENALENEWKETICAQVQLINYAMKNGYVYPCWTLTATMGEMVDQLVSQISHLKCIPPQSQVFTVKERRALEAKLVYLQNAPLCLLSGTDVQQEEKTAHGE
jgi:hypothetical protein